MENKLEQLLNSLIEKGRKPFGDEHIHGAIKAMYYVRFLRGRENSDREIYLRQIVSKESGLWQFVCENKLIKMNSMLAHGNYGDGEEYSRWDYQYRLIESALKDESELEEFLLSNIKVDVGNRG